MRNANKTIWCMWLHHLDALVLYDSIIIIVCIVLCDGMDSIQWMLTLEIKLPSHEEHGDITDCLKICLCVAAAKLVAVGYGIKKLQITAVIEDAKIESFDEIIEDHLVKDGESDHIQSVDIVAFNKI